MSSYDSFIFLFFFSFLTVFRASAQDPTSYTYHFCPNTTTFTRNSTYFINLETLLSTLSSRNASYSTGFQSTTVGKAPDKVTGLFLCRGDVTPDFCRVCVEYSVNNTLIRCPNEREVILYYELCVVSYSNRNIISTLRSTNGGFTLSNNNNISSNQVDEFVTLVSSTMNQAALEAANNVRKFYTIKANWKTDQNLYGLVQCTPDLTRQDCLSCLQSSISEMPLYRIGARHYWPSCNARYELYLFYNESAVRDPPPQSPGSIPPVTTPSIQ